MPPASAAEMNHNHWAIMMTTRAPKRKSFFYLTGLCLACIIGYLAGNFQLENTNAYFAFSGLREVSGNRLRDSGSGAATFSRSVQASFPVAVCQDDDNCEDVKTFSHVSKPEETDDQRTRRETVRRMCREYKNLSSYPISDSILKQLIVDEKYKVLYCPIPKAGCTNWKRLLIAAKNGSIDMRTISKNYAHHNNVLRTLYEYPEVERDVILESYKKFIFVRNPFIRLLSAYKDKFESLWQYRDDPNGVYFRRFAAEIMTKYRANASSEEMKSGENVTWTEFVAYVTHLARDRYNAHWMPMYRLCAPCNIDYDFIGHIESMDIDAKLLMRTILRMDNQPKAFPHYFEFTTNSSQYTYEAYGEITVQQLRRLWNIYKWDFWLFGYEKPDFI